MKRNVIRRILVSGQVSSYFGLLILSLRHVFVSPAHHYPLLFAILLTGFAPSALAMRFISSRLISYIIVCNGLFLVSVIFDLMQETALGGVFLLVPVLSLLFKNKQLYLFASICSALTYLLLVKPQSDPQHLVTVLDQMTIFVILVFLIFLIVMELLQHSTLETKHLQTILSLARSVEAKDSYTRGHSDRVASLGQLIAEDIEQADKETVFQSGLIHDVGKLTTPDRILLKTSSLTNEEFQIIKAHPVEGTKICRSLGISEDLISGVLHHHERWDGKGYPAGLKGEEIPLVSRILSVADSLDAMASNRAYRKSMSFEVIRQEMEKGVATQYDPQVVRVVLKRWDEIAAYLSEESAKNPQDHQELSLASST